MKLGRLETWAGLRCPSLVPHAIPQTGHVPDVLSSRGWIKPAGGGPCKAERTCPMDKAIDREVEGSGFGLPEKLECLQQICQCD